MLTNTIRAALALTALTLVLHWSPPASAQVLVVTGTVGEIGVFAPFPNGSSGVRFKLTDVNQTGTCTNVNAGAGYAWFVQNSAVFREWYAMLLISKKGAPITCTLNHNQVCQVTSCTLP